MSSVTLTKAQFIEYESDIIEILDEAKAYWRQTCGPVNADNGMTSGEILDSLILNFPEIDWTETLVDYLLSRGLDRGLYKMNPVDVYYINTWMVRQNPANEVYRSLSSCILALEACKRRPFVAL